MDRVYGNGVYFEVLYSRLWRLLSARRVCATKPYLYSYCHTDAPLLHGQVVFSGLAAPTGCLPSVPIHADSFTILDDLGAGRQEEKKNSFTVLTNTDLWPRTPAPRSTERSILIRSWQSPAILLAQKFTEVVQRENK